MMPAMEATAMKVLDGTAVRSPTQLQDAYELFRLERQGNLVTPRTLEFYDLRIGEFFAWLGRDAPGVERIADVDVNHLRRFRAYMAARPGGLQAAGGDAGGAADEGTPGGEMDRQ